MAAKLSQKSAYFGGVFAGLVAKVLECNTCATCIKLSAS